MTGFLSDASLKHGLARASLVLSVMAATWGIGVEHESGIAAEGAAAHSCNFCIIFRFALRAQSKNREM
jgi:hypothetical protein